MRLHVQYRNYYWVFLKKKLVKVQYVKLLLNLLWNATACTICEILFECIIKYNCMYNVNWLAELTFENVFKNDCLAHHHGSHCEPSHWLHVQFVKYYLTVLWILLWNAVACTICETLFEPELWSYYEIWTMILLWNAVACTICEILFECTIKYHCMYNVNQERLSYSSPWFSLTFENVLTDVLESSFKAQSSKLERVFFTEMWQKRRSTTYSLTFENILIDFWERCHWLWKTFSLWFAERVLPRCLFQEILKIQLIHYMHWMQWIWSGLLRVFVLVSTSRSPSLSPPSTYTHNTLINAYTYTHHALPRCLPWVHTLLIHAYMHTHTHITPFLAVSPEWNKCNAQKSVYY